MSLPRSAQAITMPAPTGGWNARDNIDDMPPTDCVELLNFIPRNNYVELRKGCTIHSSGLGTGNVESLIAHVDTDGTEKLLACANLNIYDVTTSGGTASSLASGLTNNRWQATMIDGTTVMVNGDDQPRKYTVAGGLTTTTFTHADLTDDNRLIHVCNYRGRLYLIEKDTAIIYYAADGAVAGALSKFPVGKLFNKGGNAQWVATWTRESGDTSDEILVVASTNGELLVFTGADPGASNWDLIGKFNIPRLCGRRSFFKNGPDLAVITENGVFPLTAILNSGQANVYSSISDKVSQAFNEAGRNYFAQYGWTGIMYEKGQFGLIHIPISTTESIQFAFNPQNGSWAKFQGWNGSSWALHKGDIYFGGIDGKVYKAFDSLADNGEDIPAKVYYAYTYFGDRARIKRYLELSPIMTVNGSINIKLSVDVDYRNATSNNQVLLTTELGSFWNSSLWNSVYWSGGAIYSKKNFGITGFGKAASIRIAGEFNGVSIILNAMEILFEPGGIR